MKIKKIIAIATAAAFALTGTSYAETGENLAAEGGDVTEVIEDITLGGDRIETDDASYYTNEMTVNFNLHNEAGIRSVAVLVNGETVAEKYYDSTDSIETADGEVINADSTTETEGEDAASNTSAPLTAVSDSLVIEQEALEEVDAKTAEAEEPEPAEEDAGITDSVELAAEEQTEPEAADETVPDETAADAESSDVSTELAEAVEETAAEAEETAEAVEETAETVEETADAVDETAEAVEEATEPPEEPAEAIEEPAEAVDETAEDPEEPATSTYDAELVVTDVNGNTETKKFEINTAPAETEAEEQEAVEELKAAGLNDVQVVDATTYRVEVNLTRQAVTIYKKNSSGTYSPIRLAVCSSGRSGETTPTGTFTIGPYKTKCGRSKWALLSGGSSYAQYLVRFKHGICFHSVPYKTRGDNSKMYKNQYNKLGSVASAGCVRLQVKDAKWIYDNCPNGTKVKVYRSSTASPLGNPAYKKLTQSGTYSWDPTDPDIGNPFNGGNGIPSGLLTGSTAGKSSDSASGKSSAVKVTVKSGSPTVSVDTDIAKHAVSLEKYTYTYNGKAKRPAASIAGLTKGTHYTVSYPDGCKKVGTYKVTVKGKGKYTGTKTATYKIIPKKTKIRSIKRAGKLKFKVRYKKVRKQISGYQIKYSTKSDFSKNCEKVKAKTYKRISKTIEVDKAGTYYVKVRVYKTVNGVTYYSKWSSAKKIKVK